MPRPILAIVFALAACHAAAAPVQVELQRGKHCTALAPPGWSFTGENPAGSAFGADIVRAGGAALASYSVVGVPAEMRASPYYSRWYATPQQAVMATLTRMGTTPVQCSAPSAPAPGLQLMECRTPQHVGLAAYQVFPMAGNGFVVVIRTAGTVPSLWARDGERASAVARSIRCNVPLRPATFDYTSGLSDSGKPRKKEGDYKYERWTGVTHVNDPTTGKNYEVTPGDYDASRGGYFAIVNGERRRLEPGRSN